MADYRLVSTMMANYASWLQMMMKNTAFRYNAALDKINDPAREYKTENVVEDALGFWEDALSLYPSFLDTETVLAATITDWTNTSDETNVVPVVADPTHSFGFSPIVLMTDPTKTFPVKNTIAGNGMRLDPDVTGTTAVVKLDNGVGTPPPNGVYCGFLLDTNAAQPSVILPIRLYVKI